MHTRTVAIHYVRAALRACPEPSVVLAGAGIPASLLADDRARVTPAQYTKFIQTLWEVLDDEFMGFGPRPSKRGTFAMMCLLAVHCPDLESALRRGLAFYSLFDEPLHLSLDDGRFSLEIPGDPDHFLTESLLVLWHRFSSWLIGRRIPLQGAEFAYQEPAHAAEYHLIFGCPLTFDAPATTILFDPKFLRMPVVQDEAALRRFLRYSPAELLSRRDHGADTAGHVRRLLGRGVHRTGGRGRSAGGVRADLAQEARRGGDVVPRGAGAVAARPGGGLAGAGRGVGGGVGAAPRVLRGERLPPGFQAVDRVLARFLPRLTQNLSRSRSEAGGRNRSPYVSAR
ncbi:AraC family transcriptional regulator [Lentzea indica]|uniref:AraC family transcriptional regulator n=1 Tax=Lentzea indica TaxID=2604800 RepID=UPI00406BCBBD